VALRVGAVPEMVEDGVTGLLVDEDDDEALLAAIGRLLDDEPAAAAMGARGRQRAQARYDIDRTTAELVRVLGEAASSRGGRSRP
jgi:glycosyltransferase involved in cell wall biosynthesis